MSKENNKITKKEQEYLNEYTKRNYTSFAIRFKKNDQVDRKILNHIKHKENKAKYIKELVLKDINHPQAKDL